MEATTLESVESGESLRATRHKKLEATERTKQSEDQRRGRVENRGARTLERLELADDAELPSRQSVALAKDSELE